MRLPVKFLRKLTPKFIGPHHIVQKVTRGTTYKIDLPGSLSARGIHPVFHVSLLRPHLPNNDQKFPGRSGEQIIALDKEPEEWAVDHIVTHAGKGRESEFKLLWKSGNYSWENFERIWHLEAMDAYLEAQGVDDATQLPWTDPREKITQEGEEQGEEVDTPLLEANRLGIHKLGAHICESDDKETALKDRQRLGERSYPIFPVCIQWFHCTYIQLHLLATTYTLNPRHMASLTCEQLNECITYRKALNDHCLGLAGHPGVEPWSYQLYRAMMITSTNPAGRSPTPNPRHTCFTATKDRNIYKAATQALQALMETQDKLRNILRSAGQMSRPVLGLCTKGR
ncbi:hypothetical protein FRC09_016019, partial [Ceratobasidium sp. 395]